jgi:hypothetical protein
MLPNHQGRPRLPIALWFAVVRQYGRVVTKEAACNFGILAMRLPRASRFATARQLVDGSPVQEKAPDCSHGDRANRP